MIFLCSSSFDLPALVGDFCAAFDDDGRGGLLGGANAGTSADEEDEDLRCTLGFGKFCFLSMASTSL